jgi:hypothetical protein
MIIKKIKNRDRFTNIVDNYELFVPDHFLPLKDKETPDWIKSTMDYYSNIAYSQYWTNQSMKKNYDLVNGILVKEDYFTPDYEHLVEFLDESTSVELPDYIKHYPMMNPPLNTLIGEITKRPDNVRFKAIDEHSYNEYIQAKTDLLQELYLNRIEEIITQKAARLGLLEQKDQLNKQLEQLYTQLQSSVSDLQNFRSPESQEANEMMREDDPELEVAQQDSAQIQQQNNQEAITKNIQEVQAQIQQVNQQLQQVETTINGFKPHDIDRYKNKTYQSAAEQWANLKLEQLKHYFNVRDKSEDAFRDLLFVAREFHHIYPSNDKMGMNYEVLNPVRVWFLTEPDPVFTTDCYAIGYIQSMEISKIIEKFDLTEEEVEYLREHRDDYVKNPNADVNIFETQKTGYSSITYPQHNPLRTQYEATLRSELEQHQLLDSYDPTGTRYSPYGYLGYDTRNHRFTVVMAYFKGKRKIGRLTYMDEDGQEQIKIIDERFEYDKNDPNIKIDWEYTNCWYQGYRIGQCVYHIEPLYHTDLPPIIGGFYKSKNTLPKSMVDQMKVYQIVYNICLNQLYLLLEKEVGIAVLYNLRQLPKYKDMTDEDALDKMTTLAKEQGIVGIDDSPENTKGASTFNQFTRLDLTRTQEIQSRISLASWAKQQCWELLGFSPQRLGETVAGETATGINQSLSQSFAQTEPITTTHEQIMNLVYQQLIDTAQYVESAKPLSIINYVNNELHEVFFTVNGEDLKMKDLQIFVSNRADDKRKLEEIRQLSMAYAQNQLHPYYTTMIQTSQSVSEIREFLKGDMQKKEEQQAEQQKMQQQQIEQQKQIADQQQQLEKQIADQKLAFEAEQNELDRKKDIMVAQIGAMKYAQDTDVNTNATPDALEIGRFNQDYTKMLAEIDSKQKDLNIRREQSIRDGDIKSQELKLKEKAIDSKERVELLKAQTALKNPVSGEKKKK